MIVIGVEAVGDKTNKWLIIQLGNAVSKLGMLVERILIEAAYRYYRVKFFHTLEKSNIIIFITKNVTFICTTIENVIIFAGNKLSLTHTSPYYHLETAFPSVAYKKPCVFCKVMFLSQTRALIYDVPDQTR